MDAAQTEKLKALALAAGSEKWHQDGNAEDVVWGDDGDSVCYCQSNIGAMPEPIFAEHRAAFIAASCPATVLELIADNERLRNLVVNVAPPFAAPASHLDAGDQVLDDVRIVELAEAWAMLSDGYENTPLNHCLDFARAIESEVTARCRAEGGNTSETASARLVPKGAETRMDTSFCASANSAPAAGTDKDAVIEAARKLVKAKGRYHTELNYKALAAALDDFAAHTKAREGA